MKFVKWVFLIAGIFGFFIVIPFYFLESQIAPGLKYPLFYYGFVTIDLVWQILYIILSFDPTRYRPMMIPAFLVKFLGGVSITWLIIQGRIEKQLYSIAITDIIFAVLFIIAFWLTRDTKVNVEKS